MHNNKTCSSHNITTKGENEPLLTSTVILLTQLFPIFSLAFQGSGGGVCDDEDMFCSLVGRDIISPCSSTDAMLLSLSVLKSASRRNE
jgi:nitrate reductase NapE component